MILTTSYLFSHLSSDSTTLFITPYTPPRKRDPTEQIPIEISKIAYFIQHSPSTSPDSSSEPSSSASPTTETTCYYLGRNDDSSYNTFKFVLDADSPQLPSSLDHLVINSSETSTRRRVEIVMNPKSGHGYSSALLNDVVKPLLKPFEELGYFHLRISETMGKNDGERVGREIITQSEGKDTTVIVLGGDGTVHEVLNGAVLSEQGEPQRGGPNLDLVLIPTGTANAMYYHLFPPESPLYPQSTPLSPFYSLVAFLRRFATTSSPLPLPLALNSIDRPPNSSSSPIPPPTLTSVVTSAALHACLLHDAEELRETHPGLERFKIAAQENVKRWWEGTLTLQGQAVKSYESKSKSFRTEMQEGEGGGVRLEGPFAYWVGSLVSRFEPSFVVAPLRSPQHSLAPSAATSDLATIDLVVIRPLRHRTTRAAWEKDERGEDLKLEFAEKVWEVTAGMYQGGKHVDMVYEKGEGSEDTDGGATKTEIVEVWRVNEFVWTPVSPIVSFVKVSTRSNRVASSDLKSNLVCFDGALHDLGQGGSLRTRILGSEETGVRVWC
ncbi:hypothetical protein JCM3765_003948 [Sporobolomyces pararoseus]